MVGGYSAQLFSKSPCISAHIDLWKPQPGQSNPVKYLNGHGIR